MRPLVRAATRAALLSLAGAAVLAPAAPAQRAPKGAAAPAATGPIPVATEFNALHFRSIGPATMSGRIADVAVYEANPALFYVATAHGGVWKTVNNGTTFTPLFQDQGLMSIGDVAVSQQDPDVVWVGTGESNNRQSGSWGSGVYKSTDGGRTFALVGLPDSKHINRIVIHPTNANVVLVAATGPLYGPGGDRGVFKTTDGGLTWKKVLAGDDDTGANDLVMAASDPNVLYASLYQRRRSTCCMNGGGPGSALHKSTDGGDTWTKVTGTGFPTGPLGRIAVDVFRHSPTIVYALVEGPASAAAGGRGQGGGAGGGAGGQGGPGMAPQGATTGATGTYRSTDGGATWTKMSATNARPMYFSQLRIDPVNPDRVYLGGVGLHLSVDGGRTFETDAALVTHDDVHAIWINPANPRHLLTGNDGGLAVSWDQSRTWQFIPNLPVGLFYHVSYDMEQPYNVCGGMQDNYNWCGPSASRMSRGIFNQDWFQILGGDGFVALPDLRDSRIVYTESQDGNLIRRNVVTGESRSIRPTAQNVTNAARGEAFRFHWDTPLMRSAHDPGVLLVAANRVFRSRDRGDSWEAISPDLTTKAVRDTIVTMGVAGKDITIARNDGISQWPAIITLAESPKQPGVLYAGTDDGTVQVTRDDGKTWTNITKNLPGFPAGYVYVSEVVPSAHDAGTVYVTVENHRNNDFAPYAWVSTDYGATFRSIAAGLRGEVVRTLTEDLRTPDVLYVGTETGILLSLDRGATWRRLKANFPDVRVDELTIHPRDNALLVATHGRALWILDHLAPIQEYAAAQKADAALFTPGPSLQWKGKDDRNDEFWGHQFFTGENPPTEAVLPFHLKKPAVSPLLRIRDAGGALVRELPVPDARNVAGIQAVCWDHRVTPVAEAPAGPAGARPGLTPPATRRPVAGVPEPLPEVGYQPENPCAPAGGTGGGGGGFGRFGGGAGQGPQVLPGTYTVELVAGGAVVASKPLTIVMDPKVALTAAERAAWQALAQGLHDTHAKAAAAVAPLNALQGAVRAAGAKADSLGAAVPDSVKSQWAAFRRDLDAVRGRLTAGGLGGGFGGGAPAAEGEAPAGGQQGGAPQGSPLTRLTTIKGLVVASWEVPSAWTVQQAASAKADVERAIADAAAFAPRVEAMRALLAGAGVTLGR